MPAITSSFTELALAPGGVEDHDARLGAAVDGDVVDAGARTGDGTQRLGKLGVVHLGGAHHDAGGVGEVLRQLVALAEGVGAHLGDGVHAADLAVLHEIKPPLRAWPPWRPRPTRVLLP